MGFQLVLATWGVEQIVLLLFRGRGLLVGIERVVVVGALRLRNLVITNILRVLRREGVRGDWWVWFEVAIKLSSSLAYRLSPIAYRLSPIAYRLSPIAYRLSPIAIVIAYRLSPSSSPSSSPSP
jgi:hypothetical protein